VKNIKPKIQKYTQNRNNTIKAQISNSAQEMYLTRICAAEMAVRYAALGACRKVHPWR